MVENVSNCEDECDPDGRNETKVLTRCSRILIALQEAGKGKHVLSSF